MSTLNEKTHAHITAYEQYVKRNDSWRNLELVIDMKTKDKVIVYNKDGKSISILKAGESIGSLRSRDLVDINSAVEKKPYKYKHYLSTTKGFISIFDISKPTLRKDVMDKEQTTISKLSAVLESVAPTRLYVTDDIYFDDILDAAKVPGTPKADVVITGKKKSVYVSLKAGNKAKDFQQLSGLSAMTGMQKFKEVKEFLQAAADISNKNNNRLPHSIYRPINDINILMAAIFGPDYNSAVYGINNCNMIAQGNPILNQYKDCIRLDWSGHVIYNDENDVKNFFTKNDEWRLVFGATYRAGYPITVNGRRLATNIRPGIYTLDKIKFGNAKEI